MRNIRWEADQALLTGGLRPSSQPFDPIEHLTSPLLPCTLSDSLLSDLAPSHPGPYPLGIPVPVTKAILRSWVPGESLSTCLQVLDIV